MEAIITRTADVCGMTTAADRSGVARRNWLPALLIGERDKPWLASPTGGLAFIWTF